MSGDEVYNDIRRQQDALEEKQRLQAEKKAAIEERRRATAGIDIIILYFCFIVIHHEICVSFVIMFDMSLCIFMHKNN